MMLFHTLQHTIPAAYSLLPAKMRADAATAMLLAIGLQESEFEHRRQVRGPARGYWQFEMGGVRGVLSHGASRVHAESVLDKLGYAGADAFAIHAALEHNDTLACCFARLLLWTLPQPLPDQHRWEAGWAQYLDAWRPGRPHPDKWPGNYGVGFDMVSK